MKVTMQKIKDAVEQSQELGDDELCFDVVNQLQHDSRLHDNFETALSALIEHHGADALTSLAAVMRHHLLSIYCGIGGENNVGIFTGFNPDPIFSIKPNDDMGSTLITANDIKPEK